jgi:hypothetical protein
MPVRVTHTRYQVPGTCYWVPGTCKYLLPMKVPYKVSHFPYPLPGRGTISTNASMYMAFLSSLVCTYPWKSRVTTLKVPSMVHRVHTYICYKNMVPGNAPTESIPTGTWTCCKVHRKQVQGIASHNM